MLLRRRGVLGLLLCREVVEVEKLTWTFGLSVFEYRWQKIVMLNSKGLWHSDEWKCKFNGRQHWDGASREGESGRQIFTIVWNLLHSMYK